MRNAVYACAIMVMASVASPAMAHEPPSCKAHLATYGPASAKVNDAEDALIDAIDSRKPLYVIDAIVQSLMTRIHIRDKLMIAYIGCTKRNGKPR